MKKLSLLIVFMLINSGSYADENRFLGEESDPNGRCAKKKLPAKECRALQKLAFETECVTEEEYKTIVERGIAPVCSTILGVKTHQLASWCKCGCFHSETNISVALLEGVEQLISSC